jgi:hypothetical protein
VNALRARKAARGSAFSATSFTKPIDEDALRRLPGSD